MEENDKLFVSTAPLVLRNSHGKSPIGVVY